MAFVQGDLVRIPTILEPVIETQKSMIGRVSRVWFQFLQSLYTRGFWTPIAFAAGNFTASGTMAWTLASTDQVDLAYTLIGKTMLLKWELLTTSVTAPLSATLQITIPNNKSVASDAWGIYHLSDNGAAGTVGLCSVVTNGTVVKLQKIDGSNWTAAVNTTAVKGQMAFEVKG